MFFEKKMQTILKILAASGAARRNQGEDGQMVVGKRRRNVRGMIGRGIIL
jgi:hypothetical protein